MDNTDNFAEKDYVQTYEMTDSSEDSEDDVESVQLKMDPHVGNKYMPYIGSKRVPVWAEQKNLMRIKLIEQENLT